MPLLRPLTFDLVLVAIASVLALTLRDNFDLSEEKIVALVPFLLVTLGLAGVVLPLFGVTRARWRFTSMRDYLAIVAATGAICIGAVGLGFAINRLDGVARALPFLQGLLIVSLLVGARAAMRLWSLKRPPGGGSSLSLAAPTETVLVVGFNKLAELYLQCVEQFASQRVMIAGVLDPAGHVGASLLTHRVLGAPEQIADILRELEVRGVVVDRVVVVDSPETLSLGAMSALRAAEASRTISLEFLREKMGFDQRSGSAEQPREFEPPGDQMPAFRPAELDTRYMRVKRALDVVAAAVLIVILFPVMALVGILVALDLGLPITFWQQRPGRGGRPFRVYKFRTMGAAHAACGRRRSDEERVSTIGYFLRRTRLDELPQLFAILRGHMSFVGPRPLLPHDLPPGFTARFMMRPGLTGWAQIKGGRAISPTDKAALDVWYVRHASLTLDLKILLATVPMVLFGERVVEHAIGEAWRHLQQAGMAASSEFAVEPVLVFSEPRPTVAIL